MDRFDYLTNLPNREAFDDNLGSALTQARDFKEPLSLVMVDIDHFKKVNDTHGHPLGDEVLKSIGQCLAKVIRLKGTAFRYGGEEFALLFPNHCTQEALAVAERARRTIEASPIERIQVTARFGVGAFPAAADAKALISAADEALYDAKNYGRNLVRLHGEPPPTRRAPREPERKEAQAGKLTESQKAELRRLHLRDQRIACPHDGAYFEVIDVTSTQSIGREFLIVCPDCGLSETLSGKNR